MPSRPRYYESSMRSYVDHETTDMAVIESVAPAEPIPRDRDHDPSDMETISIWVVCL